MPKPRSGEDKNNYISRCIEQCISEGKSQEQSIAICESMWNESKMSAYDKTLKKIKNEYNNEKIHQGENKKR